MAIIGTGTSISLGSFFAEIEGEVDWTNIERPSIPTSHMGISTTTATNTFANMTFTPGDLVDPGQISCTIHFNPDTRPPITAAAASCVVTFKGAKTWTGNAFITEYDPQVPMEDKMVAKVTLKFTGLITIA